MPKEEPSFTKEKFSPFAMRPERRRGTVQDADKHGGPKKGEVQLVFATGDAGNKGISITATWHRCGRGCPYAEGVASSQRQHGQGLAFRTVVCEMENVIGVLECCNIPDSVAFVRWLSHLRTNTLPFVPRVASSDS